MSQYTEKKREAIRWIIGNTFAESVFPITPSDSNFYIAAEKTILVSFKHSPQSDFEILEWSKRFKTVIGSKCYTGK